MKPDFSVSIDGINLPARYFTGMSKEEAVAKMKADNISGNAAWSGMAYDKLVAAVHEKDNPKPAEVVKAAEAPVVSVLDQMLNAPAPVVDNETAVTNGMNSAEAAGKNAKRVAPTKADEESK